MAGDSYGLTAILEEEVVGIILQAMKDTTVEVRRNIYFCISQLSRTTAGVVACVKAGVSRAVARGLAHEDASLQPLLLKCIYNLSSVEGGLNDALDNNAVKLCIQFLASNDAITRAEGARTLGLLCFSDNGKEIAVVNGAVPELMTVLSVVKDDPGLLASGSLALMAVTSTDEGNQHYTLSLHMASWVNSCHGAPIFRRNCEDFPVEIRDVAVLR